MTHWTSEHVSTLSPDAASLKNGRALAVASKWQALGKADEILWGEIKGSGSKPYQTCIDQTTPSFKCSCPSRKFPCKHGLGLALIFVTEPNALNQSEFPDWVLEWVNKREQKQAAKTAKAEVPVDEATLKKREQAQQKRAAAREDNISAGVNELQSWLYDQVRQGLSDSVTDSRLWDKMAARMVDAQALGLARQLQDISSLRFSGDGWQERLLREVGRLHLLLVAYQHRDRLSADIQADIAQHIGITVNQAELLQQAGTRDDWFMLGQRHEERDGLRTLRTWLFGIQTQKVALLLDFAAANQTLPLYPQSFTAELVFYPATFISRAIIKHHEAAVSIATNQLTLFATIAQALTDFQKALAASPWLNLYPFALRNVTLVRQHEQWWLVDKHSHSVLLNTEENRGWEIFAATGGKPMAVFGEWNGEKLNLLSAYYQD
jgi:hypothetical protein